MFGSCCLHVWVNPCQCHFSTHSRKNRSTSVLANTFWMSQLLPEQLHQGALVVSFDRWRLETFFCSIELKMVLSSLGQQCQKHRFSWRRHESPVFQVLHGVLEWRSPPSNVGTWSGASFCFDGAWSGGLAEKDVFSIHRYVSVDFEDQEYACYSVNNRWIVTHP